MDKAQVFVLWFIAIFMAAFTFLVISGHYIASIVPVLFLSSLKIQSKGGFGKTADEAEMKKSDDITPNCAVNFKSE